MRQGALLGLVHGLALFLLLVEWTATIAGPLALVALSLLQGAFLAGLGILAAPGDFYGPAGDRFVRIALTATDERVEAAASRLRTA